MRAELNNLENIDSYLSGKLSGAEKAAFEAQMEADPALKSVVQDQQLLIQTVNRQALMAEINTVAGLTATTATATVWTLSKILWTIAGSAVVVGGITTAIIYGAGGDNENDAAITATDPKSEEIAGNTYVEEEDDEIDTNFSQQDQDAIMIIDEMVPVIEEPNDEPENRNHSGSTTANSGSEEQDVVSENHPTPETNTTTEANHSSNPGNSSSGGVRIEERPNRTTTTTGTRTRDLKTFSNANMNARFPGGDKNRNKWVNKRLRYPETPKRKDLEAVVKVTFFVDEDGNKDGIKSDLIKMNRQGGIEEPFSGAKILGNSRSAKLFEREAARIVRIMPDWQPATDRFGNPKFSEVTVYVKFDIDDGCYLVQMN